MMGQDSSLGQLYEGPSAIKNSGDTLVGPIRLSRHQCKCNFTDDGEKMLRRLLVGCSPGNLENFIKLFRA
jgi:hypothetical protein